MNPPKQDSLSVIIEKVNNHKILLPDFQRLFTWKDEEMQKQFVASVLVKMPLGSVLLLEAQADEYAYKELGSKERSANLATGDVELLLDGQQRITVLSMVFSNAIYNTVSQVSNLIHQNLKRRFFIRIPVYNDINVEQDVFRAKTLKFPVRGKEDPTFLTSDVYDSIYVESFQVSKTSPFNPYSKVKLPDLVDKCTSSDENKGFLIPLFLLVEDKKGAIKNETCLKNILQGIAKSMFNHILQDFDDSNDKEKFVEVALLEEYYDYIDDDKKADRETFENLLKKQSDDWVDKFLNYLKSCVDDISLSQIVVDKTQRDRAIDIYENLNRGGVSLDIFDLIMARVAKTYNGDYYRRIVSNMKSQKKYDTSLAPTTIKHILDNKIINGGYNATTKMSCLSDYEEISSIYIDAFLNVLAFEDNGSKELSVDLTKRKKKLALGADFINENTEKACTAIDRAMFFFQTRCGIRSIGEINYKLMITIVAYIFFEDENFNDVEIHNLLEAWYWTSIFSGYYDSDQNTKMIEHIDKLRGSIASIKNGSPEVGWIKLLSKDILNYRFFSDKDFWLYKEANVTERVPKQFLRDAVCQYYLSKVYSDMFDEDEKVSVFCDKASALEKHHIIPLGSAKSYGESTDSLRSDSFNVLNSPLNFVFITKESNLDISDKSLNDYRKMITSKSIAALQIPQVDITIDKDTILAALSARFVSLQGDIRNRVDGLLP